MRVAVATIAPNITLPVWARLFRKSILPTVDVCKFRVGSPLPDMRELAREVLDFAELDVRDSFQSHGVALSELYRALPLEADALALEDDCYVTCEPEYIRQIWDRLPLVGGVMGSRMSKMLEPNPERFLDTYGSGLYPNMMFSRVAVLAACDPDLDFTSRNCGDVGHMLGEALHEHGIHASIDAHLPQCRLSSYCGTEKVIPEDWRGPWLHVGEMSVPPRMKPRDTQRPGYFEAMAAYAAALERDEVRPGPAADHLRWHVEFTRMRWPEHLAWFERCVSLMRRVFA